MSAPPRYKPLGRLADCIYAGLAASSVGAVGAAWAHLHLAAVIDRLFAGHETIGGVGYANDLNADASRLHLAAYVVTAVLFIVWFRRCYRNLLALGRSLPYSSKEAIWGWVVPIASLFRPAQIASAMWVATRPDEPSRGPVARWWALFIGSNVAAVVVTRVAAASDASSNNAGMHRVLAVVSIASILAALAAMAFVRQLTARIESLRNAPAPDQLIVAPALT